MSDLVPWSESDWGAHVITRAELDSLGLFEAKLLEWTLDEAIASRPDLEVRVSHLIGGPHDQGVGVAWRPRPQPDKHAEI